MKLLITIPAPETRKDLVFKMDSCKDFFLRWIPVASCGAAAVTEKCIQKTTHLKNENM